MPVTVNVNGRITSGNEAVVSVCDHGFLYGEGIYETVRTYNRRPFLFDRHMRRLRRSAQMIDLSLAFTDEEVAARVRDTQAAQLAGEIVPIVRVDDRAIGTGCPGR